MDDVPIRDESIRLGQFLKLANLIDSGSDAKQLMIQGAGQVNGEVETRRGRQLVPGRRGRAGRAVVPGLPVPQRTSTRSTTKISVSPGLITPPAPRSPYPRWGGMTSRRRPPTFMPWTPWSQPGDDLADAEAEVERGATVVGRVELLAGRVGHADVVHRHGAAGGGLCAVALGELGDLEVTGRRAVREVDLWLLCSHGDHPATLARDAANGG